MTDRHARFEAIYYEYVGAVRRYCHRRMEPDVADDACAETFLVAWRRLDDVPADAFPWLIGVARHMLANQSRGERRRRALYARLREPPPQEPVLEPDRDDRAVIRAAVASLPERDREAIMLVHWEGLTPAQAAQVIGTSAVAMRGRLHRARRRLERALSAADPELVHCEGPTPTPEPEGLS